MTCSKCGYFWVTNKFCEKMEVVKMFVEGCEGGRSLWKWIPSQCLSYCLIPYWDFLYFHHSFTAVETLLKVSTGFSAWYLGHLLSFSVFSKVSKNKWEKYYVFSTKISNSDYVCGIYVILKLEMLACMLPVTTRTNT